MDGQTKVIFFLKRKNAIVTSFPYNVMILYWNVTQVSTKKNKQILDIATHTQTCVFYFNDPFHFIEMLFLAMTQLRKFGMFACDVCKWKWLSKQNVISHFRPDNSPDYLGIFQNCYSEHFLTSCFSSRHSSVLFAGRVETSSPRYCSCNLNYDFLFFGVTR